MTEDCVVVLSTTASADDAKGIGIRLVEERLAACVNVVPSVRSIFIWQGAMEQTDEALLLIKTQRDRYPALEERLRALHPYSVPEIVALPIAGGSAAYLAWLRASVSEGGGESSP